MREMFPLSSLYSFLRWFVTPRLIPEDTGEARRATVILLYLLILLLSSIVNILIWLFAATVDGFTVFLLLFFAGAYALARFYAPQWGIRATIIVFLAAPYFRLLL